MTVIDREPGQDCPRGFLTPVHVRWSDMDAFQHINHARMVTLLEEARIPFLFHDDLPTAAARDGAVITDIHVKYQGQLRHTDSPLQVTIWVKKIRAVDFTLGYEVRAASAAPESKPAVVAETQLVAFNIDTQSLRRLSSPEREYLQSWTRV
ncbi:MAG: acyl-CoA thioesterase [Mycobacteriaceae bacterium]